MLTSNIICRKNADKLYWCGGLLHIGASLGFFPFDQAHHADDFKSRFSRRRDRLDRRRSSCANVVDDHDFRAGFAKTLDPLASSMLLLALANKKSIDRAARHSRGHNNWISTERQASDRGRFPALGLDLIKKDATGKLSAARIQRGGAAINVIIART